MIWHFFWWTTKLAGSAACSLIDSLLLVTLIWEESQIISMTKTSIAYKHNTLMKLVIDL